MKGDRNDATPAPETRSRGRLPYEKPAVTWEQPLEAQPSLMSGCQKTPGGGSDCNSVGPASS